MNSKKNKRFNLETLGQVSTVLASLALPNIISSTIAGASPLRPKVTTSSSSRRSNISPLTSRPQIPTVSLAVSRQSRLRPDTTSGTTTRSISSNQLGIIDSTFTYDPRYSLVDSYIDFILHNKNKNGWNPGEIYVANTWSKLYGNDPEGFRREIRTNLNLGLNFKLLIETAKGLGMTKNN